MEICINRLCTLNVPLKVIPLLMRMVNLTHCSPRSGRASILHIEKRIMSGHHIPSVCNATHSDLLHMIAMPSAGSFDKNTCNQSSHCLYNRNNPMESVPGDNRCGAHAFNRFPEHPRL